MAGNFDQQKLKTHLENKLGKPSCPKCSEPFSFGEHIMELRAFQGGGMSFGANIPILPVVPLICLSCGYTELFSGNVAGLSQVGRPG